MILAVALSALLLSIIALALSIFASIRIEGALRSTHRIQYVPVEPPDFRGDQKINQALEDGFNEEFNHI